MKNLLARRISSEFPQNTEKGSMFAGEIQFFTETL